MKRRIACMILALALAISLLPLGAITAQAGSYLNYSENVVGLIKQFEGFSASAYWDVSQWTIGYGTVGFSGQTISEAEADMALRERLNAINAKINEFTARTNLYLNQNRHDALVSFSFNCGTDWMTQGGRFYEAVVRNSDVNTFLFAISLWANVGSTPDANLLNRRMAEANLYLNGVYSRSAPSAYTYVILDPNGGTPGYGGEDKMQAYLSGSNVNILADNPVKPGAAFGGWFTSPTGGTAVKYLNSSTAGSTLYAQYGTPATVTSAYCYLRNGAGSNYTQIATVSSGTQLVILETAQVGGVMWGRCIDGWVELSNTNFVSGGISTGTTGTTATGTATTGTVVCKTGVNVRGGAGTNYPIISSAYNGQRVSIYETVNVGGSFWGRIGDNRWISLNYVKLDSTGTTAGTTTPGTSGTSGSVIWEGTTGTTGAYQLGTVTATGLRVRSGAGLSYPTVNYYRKGDQVKIFAQSTANAMVWGQTDKGWVSMNYIQLAYNPGTTTPGTTTPTTPGTAAGTVIATGTVRVNTNLHVRSGAGVNAPRVGSLAGGTAVNIYERTTVGGAEWGRIGNNQWVCLAYVVLNSGSTAGSTGTATATTGAGTVISSTNLRIRSGAGTNYTSIGSLKPGTQVNVYETVYVGNQPWGRIGNNQWVCMTYIRLNSGTAAGTGTAGSVTIPATGYQGRVTTNMNVRAGAGTHNAIVNRLTAGTTVVIYELKNVNGVYWGRIANGWVCMSYIQMSTGTGVTWQ